MLYRNEVVPSVSCFSTSRLSSSSSRTWDSAGDAVPSWPVNYGDRRMTLQQLVMLSVVDGLWGAFLSFAIVDILFRTPLDLFARVHMQAFL